MNEEFKTLTKVLSAQLSSFSEGSNPDNLTRLITPYECDIVSIALTKTDLNGNEIRFDLIPWKPTITNNSPFKGISFKESMFNGCMFGTMIFEDTRNWVDEFQFNGNEKLILKFKIGQQEDPLNFTFHIFEAKNISNDADYKVSTASNERLSLWKLELISSDIFLPNYYKTILQDDEDFVGYLSKNKESQEKGLINYIFEKFNLKVNKVDESNTGVWLKHDHVAYPWMKRKGQMRISQLFKYLTNYAWSGNFSKYQSDYFWWEDRDGWNFRSISKMLTDESSEKIKKPIDGFIVTLDETSPNKILDLKIDKEYSIQNLLDSGSLLSFYKRVEPNYDNPYIDFTDSSESIKVKDVVYDYNKSYSDIVQIDNYKLVSDNIDTNPILENGKPKQSVRFDDEIYGYFYENFLNTPTPQDWEVYGKTASTPWSKKAWQPQFDLTELKFSTFKDIHQKIRKPLKKKREEYARKKNIKRKWETYRCTVCCHENGALGSTADIELFNNPGSPNGYTYNALFGPTGMFSEYGEEYKIVAAGSFTDLLNYDSGNTFNERGLTYSYDLTKEPYNQSIGSFFNIKGPTAPVAYSKFVLERATKLYDVVLSKIDERIQSLDTFINTNCAIYKQTADDIYNSVLLDKVSDHVRPIDLTQGFRYFGDAIVGETITEWPINQCEFGMLPASTIPINKGVAQVVFGSPTQQFAPSGETITFRNLEIETNNITFRGLDPGCPDFIQPPEHCVRQIENGGPCSQFCCEIYFNNRSKCQYPELPQCCANGSTGDDNPDDGLGGESDIVICCTDTFSFFTTSIGCNAVNGQIFLDCDDAFENCDTFVGGFYCQPPGGGNNGERGPTGPTGATGPTGPSSLPTIEDVRYISPSAFAACSNDPIIRGFIKYTTESAVGSYSPIYLYAAPYLWDQDIKDWSFFDYGSESGLIPAITNPTIAQKTRSCLANSGCYNTTCLSSVALEVLRRTCVAEKQVLTVEKELYTQLKEKVVQDFNQKWNLAYTEWYSRNAFFYSKKPGNTIFRNDDKETISSPLSLQNIKKITRKEIRGSRYELLANKVGITGNITGQWMYSIFFANDQGSTKHPYYDQKYNENGFITSREPHSWFSFTDADGSDDPQFFVDQTEFTETGPSFRGSEYVETGSMHVNLNSASDISSKSKFTIETYGFAQSDLDGFNSILDFKDTFNFYNTVDKKPPNIKKEEISSYVRVEFKNPIGLDRIKDFPNGFIRDAGSEYFLPYIVNLTPGPFGRQGVKYNVAVIGMDPYGFDVAVKKIKDDIPVNRRLQGIDKGNYYNWWNHDTGSVLSKTEYLTTDYNGMDLWPEVGFETEFPYYAYDPMQEDMHSGGYDLDFHNGGGYYYENDSQDWMESLYHYGMSSGKQYDPLYRTSVLGSYILPNSYRKLKPHRSWWSLFVPRNLFVPVRFANMFKTPNTKARDMFGGKAVFTISPNYWRNWYGSEFKSWLSLTPLAKNLFQDDDTSVSFYVDSDESTTINPIKNSLTQYFNDSLMNYLAGNYILYRPSVVSTENIWKYDLSGETEYGLITPPVDTEYDFFDRNFSMQFSVISRSKNITCESIGLKCANPTAIKNGPIISSAGCTAEPYCECPAKYLIPSESEPTYLELYRLYNEINECALIEKILGKDYLGCDFSDPTAPCSCNCPEQGKEFKNYLAYDRTYATFWETPNDLPLKRLAQTNQLTAQQVTVTIPANDKIKIGELVELINPNDLPDETTNEFKKISGRWLVTEIQHTLSGVSRYSMNVTLNRNSLHYDPNNSTKPVGPFGKE